EQSLRENRPRSLVQMATGSGKTLLAIVLSYRLLKFAGARRALFLVDRGNLGRQTLKEFQQYVSPYNNYKFSEEYIVQRLTSNTLDTTARVCISTIQRLYSMLKGKDLAEEDEEQAVADGVNVNYDVYRIKTEITEGGSKVDAGYYVDKRDRATRAVRWEQLDEELQYEANQLVSAVVAPDQIRTVVRTYRDKLFGE